MPFVVKGCFFCLLLLAGVVCHAGQILYEPETLGTGRAVFPPCEAGPTLVSITEITDSSLLVQFHGLNVLRLNYQILAVSTVVRAGSRTPTSSLLPLTFARLPPGTYYLRLTGANCQGISQKEFRIPADSLLVRPLPAPARPLTPPNTYELVMNLTGYGYEPATRQGLHPDWVERIEAFRYTWGYGITGIRLCVRWYEWEPTPGVYTRAGLQRVIAYCRERGLKLSVFFWPWRIEEDGFIPAGHLMTGHRGSVYGIEGNKRMASLASEEVNEKMYTAVRELAHELSSYEGGYYLSIGTAAAEELTNPVVGLGEWAHPELVGFEAVFQAGFRRFCAAKGRPLTLPGIREWEGGCALRMEDDAGKDFARYVSLSLMRYFENFTRAVQEGSNGSLRSVYMYPDAGSPQNAWYLHANFAAQAASADGMYGTDGLGTYDTERKLLVNAVNLGMGKISMNEYDPDDLGRTGGYCSGINLGLMEQELARSYAAGVQAISLAMAFCPDEIRAMEPALNALWRTYVGKPYRRPDHPVTVVPIGQAFFSGQEIYMPYFRENTFLRPSDSDFWEVPPGEDGKK